MYNVRNNSLCVTELLFWYFYLCKSSDCRVNVCTHSIICARATDGNFLLPNLTHQPAVNPSAGNQQRNQIKITKSDIAGRFPQRPLIRPHVRTKTFHNDPNITMITWRRDAVKTSTNPCRNNPVGLWSCVMAISIVFSFFLQIYFVLNVLVLLRSKFALCVVCLPPPPSSSSSPSVHPAFMSLSNHCGLHLRMHL